ncbi:hypothetical protein AGMMS49975_14120 [Clostridia bacterium]|nr:hypothetical protein AGMMS49975_14120 [Clostridia bacterium]
MSFIPKDCRVDENKKAVDEYERNVKRISDIEQSLRNERRAATAAEASELGKLRYQIENYESHPDVGYLDPLGTRAKLTAEENALKTSKKATEAVRDRKKAEDELTKSIKEGASVKRGGELVSNKDYVSEFNKNQEEINRITKRASDMKRGYTDSEITELESLNAKQAEYTEQNIADTEEISKIEKRLREERRSANSEEAIQLAQIGERISWYKEEQEQIKETAEAAITAQKKKADNLRKTKITEDTQSVKDAEKKAKETAAAEAKAYREAWDANKLNIEAYKVGGDYALEGELQLWRDLLPQYEQLSDERVSILKNIQTLEIKIQDEAKKEYLDAEKLKIKEIDALNKGLTASLKRQYEEQKDAAISAINDEVAAVKSGEADKIAAYDKTYSQALSDIQKRQKSEMDAINSQLAALDALDRADSEELAKTRFDDKVADLTTKFYAADTYEEREKIQREINETVRQEQMRLNKQARDDQRAYLKEQQNDLKEQHKKELKDLESSKLKELEIEKNAAESKFKVLLEAERLNAEALKLMTDNNLKEMENLLNSYNSNWKLAGLSAGESYLSGYQTAFSGADLSNILDKTGYTAQTVQSAQNQTQNLTNLLAKPAAQRGVAGYMSDTAAGVVNIYNTIQGSLVTENQIMENAAKYIENKNIKSIGIKTKGGGGVIYGN